MNTIKPPVVLASGDLTDARDNDFIGARQYVREWQIYNDLLARSNVRNKTIWMDIKGNHGMDNFRVCFNSKFTQFLEFMQFPPLLIQFSTITTTIGVSFPSR